jgi:hypothetical protein
MNEIRYLKIKKYVTKNDFLLKSQSTHSCLFRSVYMMSSNFLSLTIIKKNIRYIFMEYILFLFHCFSNKGKTIHYDFDYYNTSKFKSYYIYFQVHL